MHSYTFRCLTTCQYDVIYGAMAQWLRRWIPSPGVPCSRPLGGSNVVSAFHLSKIDQMITRNFWEESVRKLTASSEQLYIQLPMFYHLKHQPQKMVKYTQTIRWQQATNCLSVFDHFVGLARKRLEHWQFDKFEEISMKTYEK